MARILFLTPQLPYPPHQGTSLRNYHMLKALAQEHDITLLSFNEGKLATDLSPLEKYCRVLAPVQVPSRTQPIRFKQLLTSSLPDVALRLKSETFATSLQAALHTHTFDAVQVEGIELASYIRQLKIASPRTKIVLDCHNAETELQRRARAVDLGKPSRWPAAAYSTIQIGRLARFEAWAMEAADSVLAVSENDRDRLSALMPSSRVPIAVVPNTIDVAQYERSEGEAKEFSFDLVFTGKMDYRPNVDGVLWFAEKVWPALRAARPGTTWAVVGQKPHARLNPLQEMAGITVTGFVPHIQPYLAGSSIYIVPLRIGSGTRLKILEAMASCLPIVSSRIGAEGFAPGRDGAITLADSPEEWVATILDLLADENHRLAMGSAARVFANQYDWRTLIPMVNQIYSELSHGNNG